MITRRQAREWAVQMLVQFDLNPPTHVDEAIQNFWELKADYEAEKLIAEETRETPVFATCQADTQNTLSMMRLFAEERARGAWHEREQIDPLIEKFLRNWSLYRLGSVERSVLRLATWELLHCPDIPTVPLVNEAVDLAKFFSETKSGKFVNGVLDHLAKEVRAPKEEAWQP